MKIISIQRTQKYLFITQSVYFLNLHASSSSSKSGQLKEELKTRGEEKETSNSIHKRIRKRVERHYSEQGQQRQAIIPYLAGEARGGKKMQTKWGEHYSFY